MEALNVESLFSLELVIDKLVLPNIQCRFPAVAFRMLDFPTLLIYHVEPSLGDVIKRKIKMDPLFRLGPKISELVDKDGSFPVKKGKSCLIKMAGNALLTHLQSTPLYVMIVDTFPDTLKLIGNATIPLDNTMEKLHHEMCNVGLALPVVQGEKGCYKIYNLMGKEVGYITLGIRMLSLGVGLIQHLPKAAIAPRAGEKPDQAADRVHSEDQERIAEIVMEDFRKVERQMHDVVQGTTSVEAATSSAFVNAELTEKRVMRVQMPTQTEREVLQNMSTQTDVRKRQKKQVAKLDIESQIKGNIVDDVIITNTVCPPPLFFNNDLEPKQHKDHLDLINRLRQVEAHAQADDLIDLSDEEDTIRVEDISDTELEYQRLAAHDSFKARKAKEKPFLPPSTLTSLSGKQQLDMKDFPLLNAIMTEISAIATQATQPTLKKQRHATIQIAKPRRDSSPSPKRKSKSGRGKSKSPHQRGRPTTPGRERESIENFVRRMHSPKASMRELPIIKPTYDTSHQPTPRKPTHSSKCDHGPVSVPKTKSWLRKTPVPMEVKKTKLSYGLTNTQRLRLEKSNPQLLKSLDRKEAERVQRFREQRRQEEEARAAGGANRKLYDGSTRRGPILFGRSPHDDYDEHDYRHDERQHRKPVPTPRQSLHSPQHSFFEPDTHAHAPQLTSTMQQVHDEYRNQYNATPDIDVLAESNYGADRKTSTRYVDGGDNAQRRVAAQRRHKRTVLTDLGDDAGDAPPLNNPGFPVSESGGVEQRDAVSYAEDFEDVTDRTASRAASARRDVPKRSYYGYTPADGEQHVPKTPVDDVQHSPQADTIQVKALDPAEELGLRQFNERYSDGDDDDDDDSFKSALSHSDHVEVKPYPVSSDSPTDARRSGASPALPPYTAPSNGQRAAQQQYPGVDASVESTAYISRSQVFANQSQDSDISAAAKQHSSASDVTKRSGGARARPVIRRRNTDSVSSYVGDDDISSAKSRNYSDESFDVSSNEADLSEYAIPDPLSMKDMQISKEAKLGYTWA